MMPKPISTANAEEYDWGDQCKGWHLMRAASVSIIEELMPPDTKEARHWHARARQFFYVLDGELVIEVEGVEHTLPVGHGLELPSGNAHQVRNEGNGDARFLVISSPPHQGDRRETDPT
jgi:mannose-6-phosphate isomerase-like protein (cupin superfamily)